MVGALIDHPAVRRINFTGSTAVGRIIAKRAAEHLKPVLLELGGKAPLIVLEDADLDEAVKAAAFGAFMNQGQICMSTERIIVVDAVADAFAGKFKAKANSLPPLGAVVDRKTVDHVNALLDDALGKGASALTGGRQDDVQMGPTVVDGVTPAMNLYRDESFGPIVAIIRAKDEDDAIRLANDSSYGLRAAVFTRDTRAGPARRAPDPLRHLPHQRADRGGRAADAVRRRRRFRLRPVRRQGRHRQLHRAALDHHRHGPGPLSNLGNFR